MTIDFNRPAEEDNNPNSMDLEPGQEYDVYISYYLGKPLNKED